MRVAFTEPGRHGTWVRTAHDDGFDVVCVHFFNEVGKICETLLRVQEPETVERPVLEGL